MNDVLIIHGFLFYGQVAFYPIFCEFGIRSIGV